MRTLITALILAALTGCATYGYQQRAARVGQHPEWDATTRQDVLNGRIRAGMTKQQVHASWGEPCGPCRGTYQTSAGDWWEYNPLWPSRLHHGAGTYLFFGPDGKLQYWSGR